MSVDVEDLEKNELIDLVIDLRNQLGKLQMKFTPQDKHDLIVALDHAVDVGLGPDDQVKRWLVLIKRFRHTVKPKLPTAADVRGILKSD